MIEISVIAASAAEAKPVEKPGEDKPLPKKQSVLPRSVDAAAAAALSPASGSTPAAGPSQMVTTQPVFDAAYLRNPPPDYPAHAKRRGMEGTVMLEVLVSGEGAARQVMVAQSSGHALLDESAKDAVARWKFVPARRAGAAVEARVIVPVEFRLQ
jgi:protein TonB